ncbi:type IX secretion system periplasmic lipoprotein PorW/SprE [Lutibacter sp.]
MKNSIKIFVGFLVIIFIGSCSTKKDAFLNRSFHKTTTKYNILYNGNEALRIGLLELNSNYEDNYWERLPIEPLKIDVLALPGMSNNTDSSPKEFERAEEKAVKAIQKHSMLIARQERNSQIDDAYLLLGKSRYYSKRFVPALEAFNFVLLNYPRANLINETKIWQAKTLVRLQNEEQAIDNLNKLLKKEELTSKIKEEAHTAIAMAYIKMDSLQQVTNHLNKAVIIAENKDQTARNLFILGQIYNYKNLKDSSNIAFQKVIDLKKAPYKYKIHAYIEKAKNVEEDEVGEMTLTLLKLIKDRDNRPYLDQLNYHTGMLQKEENSEKAITYFKQALYHSKKNDFQKELTYEALGNLFFDKTSFLKAGAYYDSILQITQAINTKRIRSIKRKRDKLSDVILYENISKRNDSILNLVAMSEEERNTFFSDYIVTVRAKDKEEKERISAALEKAKKSRKKLAKLENTGTWYFYNPQTVLFGKKEFKTLWGNRLLNDNWRLASKTIVDVKKELAIEALQVVEVGSVKRYEVWYYTDQIPTDKMKIDSIKAERDLAYFKLGVIYKEQFKELELATGKFETLRTFHPISTILLPTKYHLYKIYTTQNNKKAISLKNDIVNDYPNSKYAKIILNPNKVLNGDDKTTSEDEYALVFYEYKDELFESVIKKTTIAISKYEGEKIVSKFELLKAYAIGKKDGLKAFKEALDFVAMNYPNTEEGKKALEVSNTIKTKI